MPDLILRTAAQRPGYRRHVILRRKPVRGLTPSTTGPSLPNIDGVVAVLVIIAAALAGIVAAPGFGPMSAEAAGGEESIQISAPGPLGAISVIGDSVLVGAAIEPSLPTNLAAAGWGPIRFRAGLGYSAGNFQPGGSRFSVTNWIKWWRAEGWDAPNVAVNLGNNDVGFCRASIICNADSIRYVMDAIGPDKAVWWSKITRLYTLQAEADAYNAALELVAGERANLRLWDWPAAQAASGIALSWDAIHLRDAVSYRTRSALMAESITGLLAVGERRGTDAALPVAAGPAAEYRPLQPVRVLDTRIVAGSRLAAGGQVVIDLSSFVPVGATAVAVNLTAVDPAAAGFLTGHPCATTVPSVSSANFTARTDRGALAVLPLSPDRSLCVFTSSAADVVVDLQGAFVPEASRLTPRTPERLADTRATGRPTVLRLDVPLATTPDATAVALTLTATGASRGGFVTAYPCGGPLPGVSNLNFGRDETVAGAAYVPVGDGGDVCLFSNVQADVDIVVDLTGVFGPTGALAFTRRRPPAPTTLVMAPVGGNQCTAADRPPTCAWPHRALLRSRER